MNWEVNFTFFDFHSVDCQARGEKKADFAVRDLPWLVKDMGNPGVHVFRANLVYCMNLGKPTGLGTGPGLSGSGS